MKNIIIAGFIIVLIIFAIACIQSAHGQSSKDEPEVEEIKIKSKTGYYFEKIYIRDRENRTHEILFINTGHTNGGVAVLELCVYGNRRGKENY